MRHARRPAQRRPVTPRRVKWRSSPGPETAPLGGAADGPVLQPSGNMMALDFLPVPLVTLDERGLIRDCNAAVARLFGCERHHLLRLPFAAFVQPEQVGLFVRHLQRCRQTRGESVESELQVRGAGRQSPPVQIITRAVFGPEGKTFQTALIDLTERKERERSLEEARQYTVLLEFVPVPLLVLDLHLNVITTNAALRDRLRCTRADVEGCALDQIDLVRWSAPQMFAALRAVAQGGPPLHNFSCEAVLVGLGERLAFLVSARKPARVEGKRPVLLVAMRDVTQQRAAATARETLLQELSQLNAQLEARIGERTADLQRANRELRALSRRLVEAQETERRKVADVLHDDIGQLLTALNSVLKRSRGRRAYPNLTEAESIVADLLERIRQLAHDLRPHVLDNLGLAVALRWHVKKFSEQTGIRVTLRLRHVRSGIAPEVATTVFRVVQEALTNVARHSGARRARVSVTHREGAFDLEIHDNGCGFDPEHLPKDSSGLVNLRERVRLSGGEFTIESQRGRGTTVRATVPVVSASTREAP